MSSGVPRIDRDGITELDRGLLEFPLFEIPLTALKVFLLADVRITRARCRESGDQSQK
jgi:hypothetical protein